MIKLNSGGKLPDKFRIANQEITVVMEDSIPNNNYGYFCDATNTIKLARTLQSTHDGTMPSSIWNVLLHLVIIKYLMKVLLLK